MAPSLRLIDEANMRAGATRGLDDSAGGGGVEEFLGDDGSMDTMATYRFVHRPTYTIQSNHGDSQ